MPPEIIDSFEGEYRFLSNFYPSPIIGPRDLPCATVEHAFQAAKAMLFLDAQWIAAAPTPSQAKKRGRQLKTIRPDWDDVRVAFMTTFLLKKFSDPKLRQRLLDTGNATLIEGNWWGDTYWGVCKGVGKNNLGRLLMSIRSTGGGPPTSSTTKV